MLAQPATLEAATLVTATPLSLACWRGWSILLVARSSNFQVECLLVHDAQKLS